MAAESNVRPGTHDAHLRAVTRVIGTMRQRLDAGMSLGDMAGVAYMSRFHFDRTFRSITGVPPRQYLRALRLQAAKRLLVETSSSVTDVCLDVGYSSLGTFIRSFTDLLGVSPRRLRLLARKANQPVPLNLTLASDRRSEGSVVSGQVTAPDGFAGPVFVGLFRTAIPQGLPAGCAIAVNAGPYRIGGVREGTYHLFALGMTWPASSRELILGESALRAGGQLVEVRPGQTLKEMDLNLRQPLPLDPPILVTLPVLLARHTALRAGLRRRGTRLAAAG